MVEEIQISTSLVDADVTQEGATAKKKKKKKKKVVEEELEESAEYKETLER